MQSFLWCMPCEMNFITPYVGILKLMRSKKRCGSLVIHQIGEDEVNDPSLVSLRVYGTRIHSDVVRLACGTSFTHGAAI